MSSNESNDLKQLEKAVENIKKILALLLEQRLDDLRRR